MPSESLEQLLEHAASLCGIEPGYWDIWGRYIRTTTEVRQSILRSMGVPCASAEEIAAWLAANARSDWERLAPPTIVTVETGAVDLALSIPAESLGERAQATVLREDGQSFAFELNLWDLPQTGSAEMQGRTWVRKQARLAVALPLGYHQITVRVGSASSRTYYIVTPERAWTHPHLGRGQRAAGLAISLYGVRSARNWGCGDFRDLLDVVDWVADDLESSFVALNPLHAIHNRRPFNTSPYLPNCIFYQNYLYLDVEGMEDFTPCRHAVEAHRSPAVEREIDDLRRAPFVEYERVAALKLRFLKLLFARFLREWRQGTPRTREFDQFREREGTLLEQFATYSALDEHLHSHHSEWWTWPQWPAEYQDPASAETAAFRQRHWRAVMFYQYVQWQIDIQLRRAQQHARDRRLALGLYHDLALATDRFGSDLWAHRPFYIAGCRVGSPPDDFSPNGQDWGFPPPNPVRYREDGYRLFAEMIRKNCRHGGVLRMDHVMRLFRLYWIPDHCDARQGAYVRETSLDLLRILALESVRHRVVVVGEDLGTVQPEIREVLARFGVLSYRLFYFEKNERGEFRSPGEYPPQALVSSTTHDLPTLAGFWMGADLAMRRDAGILSQPEFEKQSAGRAEEKQKMLDALFAAGLMPPHLPRQAPAYPELTGELHHAIVGFLAGTPSQLLAINQEDLTKEVAQQNLPATTWQYPNWGRKMRYTLEELRSHPEAKGYAAMFRNWIVQSGRKNQAME